MEIKKVGLCGGRHIMPVSDFIFEQVDNPLDFNNHEQVVREWVTTNLELVVEKQLCTDEFGTDFHQSVIKSREHIDLYVTGLTCLLVAVIKVFTQYGVSYTLYHYDRDTGHYYPQTCT